MEGAAAAADELCCTFILLFTFLRSELTAPLKKQGFLDSYGMRLLKLHCLISEWASRLANWLLAEPLWKLSLLCIMHIFLEYSNELHLFLHRVLSISRQSFCHVQKHFFPVKMFAGCMNGAESRQSCKLCAHLPVYGTVLAPGVSDSRWLVNSGYLLLNLVLASTTRTTKTFGDVVWKRQLRQKTL